MGADAVLPPPGATNTTDGDTVVCYPYGVGHDREGVSLGLSIGPHRVLLDCGLSTLDSLEQSRPPDLVICSHAHPDHGRGLGLLQQRWPQVPIYATAATSSLLTDRDLVPTIQVLSWRSPVEVAANLTIELWPAGHLPGAACVLLTYAHNNQSRRVFYTGDCFLSSTRLVEGLPLSALRGLNPDVLIVEGTLGATQYPNRRYQENKLIERLRSHLDQSRCVVFPVPLVGLGQELLMLWRSHYHFTGQPLTIWVDPALVHSCDAYLQLLEHHPDTFPRNVQNFAQHQSIFWDERVNPTIKPLPKLLNTPEGNTIEAPAVLLVHPATPADFYCQRYRGAWSVFLPEHADLRAWQAQVNTYGPAYDWFDSFKNTTTSGTVQLETYQLYSHCDGDGTTQLIHNLRPRHVVLVHGQLENLSALANLESLHSRYQLHIPLPGNPLSLFLGTQFSSPPPPQELTFEGTVNDSPVQVSIQLPPTISTDVRWQSFAETGIIEAHWQGENLVLRGVDPSELTAMTNRLAPDRAVCDNCQFYQQRSCQQIQSPLFGKIVAPDGYCPEFQPR
ncbi:MBL fold metallo-hydrolase [Leptolyngbya cf. ectocarpi LEGE 11479]|uniref:MBL fold metallo-hydrolase n=1 Tax=Leptolyngbya cf. ectocarpi LEGE 11479 TaxID=1828722 RepID=A0A928WZ94_LEPEC|nr:MBL fold metallo-hydrolase [Leptolyngbya ectocarpi]MBE9066129.1 MBL fold metallo-hydrolase [Leptolyngbya cf. ectocarpi LEGE 11479]